MHFTHKICDNEAHCVCVTENEYGRAQQGFSSPFCNKEDSFALLLDQFSFNFSIIMFSETWYQNDSKILNLPGYNAFYINRNNKRGGGVAAYVTDRKHCEIVSEFTSVTDDYEVLTVMCKKQAICVIYRPPTGNVLKFFDFFEGLLDYISKNNYYLVCGGDFNLNILDQDWSIREFNTLLSSYGFANLISTATRVTQSTSSALDLLITDIETTVHSAGTVASGLSDHCPVFLIYHSQCVENDARSEPLIVQRVTQDRLLSFNQDVMNHDWSFVLNISNVNDAYTEFMQAFVRIYMRHFPFTVVKPSKKIRKPWVTQEHIKMIKNKNFLYHSFLRTRSETTLKQFKRFRNNLNTELRRSKINYYQNIFGHITRQRPDVAWKTINDVLGRNTNRSGVQKLTVGNRELTGEELADYFNTHFVNVKVADNNQPDISTQFSNSTDSIFIQRTDEIEINNTFMLLRNSKALDIDNIQIEPVKYVLPFIASPLAHIFNLAIEHGIFPDAMKKARVSVIYKGGDKNNPSNYRPISVLPVFSKGLEKIICSRLTNFFDAKNVLTESQFGFRAGKSTELALLTLKENILGNIEQNLYTVGLFLDFSKAFDLIDHDILTIKLKQYGIRGSPLALLESYLRGRQQCVFINNHKSSLLPVTHGVPQGSILGPLLFNTYINDIVLIDPEVKFMIYADDTTFTVSGSNLDRIILKCNELLNKISLWSKINKLKINPNKTKAIIFRAKNKQVSSSYHLSYEHQPVEIVSDHKILGVYFSSNLNWDTHIDSLSKKLSAVTGVLSRCCSILPQQAKLQIYYALFYSHINYCNLVWATTTKRNMNRIVTIQKRIIRQISNLKRTDTTKEAFLVNNVLRADKMYEFRLLQIFNCSSPQIVNYLSSLASLQHYSSTVKTRCTDIWAIPHFRTNYKFQSLSHNVPMTLNRHQHTSGYSRKQLRTYILQS